MRPVAKGEEITVDYATAFSSDTQAFGCGCGSADCRHVIQPSYDSQNPALRERYRGHFADFLEYPETYETDLAPIDPACPTTSYLSTKLQRTEAKIHGLGLVVVSPIRKDELLGVRGGTIAHKSEVISRQDELKGSEVQILEDVFLAGFSEKERLATMMGFNHSCEPNAYLRGQIGVFAMRDVAVGEEMAVDYATAYISPSQKFDCNCGTPSCRGLIDTSVDWQNPDLQSRYKGHFADFIQRKMS